MSAPCDISWILWTIFSELHSNVTLSVAVSRAHHDMTQLSRLKVTGQGQGIYPLISCPLHISWTLLAISLKFIQMLLSVRLSAKPMTRLHRFKVKFTLQSLGIYPSIHVRSISPEPFEWISLNFTQTFLSVRWCAELMAQLCRLKVKVTLQGHGIYPWISWLVSFKSPQPFVRFSLNITHMFLLVSWCAEV